VGIPLRTWRSFAAPSSPPPSGRPWARAAADADFRARYESSLVLCLRHLAAVSAQTADAADQEWLLRAERRLVERLSHELSEFWRKHDYRFHDEPMGEEGTSWQRVLHKFAGAPGIVWR